MKVTSVLSRSLLVARSVAGSPALGFSSRKP
jgi:hypothetical protein